MPNFNGFSTHALRYAITRTSKSCYFTCTGFIHIYTQLRITFYTEELPLKHITNLTHVLIVQFERQKKTLKINFCVEEHYLYLNRKSLLLRFFVRAHQRKIPLLTRKPYKGKLKIRTVTALKYPLYAC